MGRNNRLNPKWYHNNYYGLMMLKKELNNIFEKYLNNMTKEAELLDFGCGDMPYEQLYNKYISRYYGADLDNNQQKTFSIDLETSNINAQDDRFDVILSTQVLEHVDSPESYLKEAYRITKKNGILILSTHGFYPYHPSPNDYWRWTKSGLNKLLIDNNWDPIATTGVIGFTALSLALFQYSISAKLPIVFRLPFEVIMQRLVALSDKLLDNNSRDDNSLIYIVVAKKC